MLRLMGKFKNGKWEEFDHIDIGDGNSRPIEDRKEYLEREYRETFGQGYMFKWVPCDHPSSLNA